MSVTFRLTTRMHLAVRLSRLAYAQYLSDPEIDWLFFEGEMEHPEGNSRECLITLTGLMDVFKKSNHGKARCHAQAIISLKRDDDENWVGWNVTITIEGQSIITAPNEGRFFWCEPYAPEGYKGPVLSVKAKAV